MKNVWNNFSLNKILWNYWQKVSIISRFDGNTNNLHRFKSALKSILTYYYATDNPENSQNILLLNGILNKLLGRVEEVIGITGASNNYLYF